MKLRDSIANGVGDAIFLALDAPRAKVLRSYLGSTVSIFATSLVHTTAESLANFELNGVYFVDMPWLLASDHPAVIRRQEQVALSSAFLCAESMPTLRRTCSSGANRPLDGVTGTLQSTGTIDMLTVRAVQQGEMRILGDPASRSQR
jgi:outer membrane PBP1 activator LpoA protein